MSASAPPPSTPAEQVPGGGRREGSKPGWHGNQEASRGASRNAYFLIKVGERH